MAAPSAEIDIEEALVRSLLEEQMPDLAALPIRVVANGWDNAIVRIGHEWTARLPRRAVAATLIEHEQRWLPVLAPRLPLAVPVPTFCGVPTERYPWPWTVARWLLGDSTAEAPPTDQQQTVETLAAFLRALHVEAPDDAPTNPFRGVALQARADAVARRTDSLTHVVDRDRTLAVWASLSAAPKWDGPRLWLHGDLHPSNMLTFGGRLSAVIDFGDLTSGDPATDLALAWMMFDAQHRTMFRSLADVDDDTWQRAAGWALNLSLAYLTGDDTTSMPGIGRHTLSEVLAEFG
jgi:aminoglycoside phosphotransferase (APT) family kinase protein